MNKFMENLKFFMPLFSAIISFCAFLGSLGLLFNLILSPIKKDMHRIEKNMVKIEKEIVEIKEAILKRQSVSQSSYK